MTTKTELAAKAKALAEELVTDVAAIQVADDDERDELLEGMWTWPLCVDRLVTLRVTLGTGGPACGVDFVLDDNQLARASVWWQDWFTEREHVELDDDTAEFLFTTWIAE